MQKKLLAIAVGATMVAAPMFAQADVKLKGQLQVELTNVDGGKNIDGTTRYDSVTRQGDYGGRSRWLIDASKDLGNGLKAIGRVSWKINPSDGAAQSARDQYVGLAGGFGAIVGGRLPTPYKMNGGVKWDPFVTTFMQARNQGGMSAGALGHESFVNDVLAYVMPEIAGINATFAYVASDDNDTTDSGTFTAGGTGKWGPIEAMLAYTNAKFQGTPDVEQKKLGVRYKGNGLTAAWQFEDVDASGGIAANKLATGFTPGAGKFNFLNLGYKFGNTLIAGNYGDFSADNDGQDNTYTAIGVKYFFDKKVSVYGGYTGIEPDDDDKYNIWGAGMRYDF